jgi:hypothetical protein
MDRVTRISSLFLVSGDAIDLKGTAVGKFYFFGFGGISA